MARPERSIRDGAIRGTRLSPAWPCRREGDRVVVSIPDSDGDFDLCMKQLGFDAAAPFKLTFEGRSNFRPSWSPDGPRASVRIAHSSWAPAPVSGA